MEARWGPIVLEVLRLLMKVRTNANW